MFTRKRRWWKKKKKGGGAQRKVINFFRRGGGEKRRFAGEQETEKGGEGITWCCREKGKRGMVDFSIHIGKAGKTR